MNSSCKIYKGIKYATAGRFKYPVMTENFDPEKHYDTFGPASVQKGAYVKGDPAAFYNKEFYNGEHVAYDEDCLYLNIWAPDKVKRDILLPVLVYVHGGAFDHGYSYEKPFDGSEYVKRGIMVVTVAYRVCAPGYLCLPSLASNDGQIGNYALYDILTALKWIKKNIGLLGGDAENITLAGQSAGAMSVQALCLSPLSKGLFHKAYMMSGGGYMKGSPFLGSIDEQVKLSHKFVSTLNLEKESDIYSMPIKELTLKYLAFRSTLSDGMRFGLPTVDGYFMPKDIDTAVTNGGFMHIPYILGTTSEDILLDLFDPQARNWALLNEGNTYIYKFQRQLPGDNAGAWHSSDLWYFFGAMNKCWRPFTEWDYRLSGQYMDIVSSFIKTGCPNTSDTPVIWQPYTAESHCVLNLGNDTISVKCED